MAIQYKLKDTETINVEGNRVYLLDDTGEYSTSNVGGYGNEESEDAGLNNPKREDVALVIVGVNKTSKGDVATTFELYNPLSADHFNAIITKDGWYRFSLAALPIYDEFELGGYDVGMILYNPILAGVVKINTNSFGENIAVELPTIKLLESSYIVATVDRFFVAYTSKTRNRINTIISNLLTTNVGRTDRELVRWKENYRDIDALLRGTIYEYCRGNKAVAQKDMEFINTNNYVSE